MSGSPADGDVRQPTGEEDVQYVVQSVSSDDIEDVRYSDYLPEPAEGEMNMLDEESIEEWVERQTAQVQVQELTTANTPCILCKVHLCSLMEELATQDPTIRLWKEATPGSKARHWVWLNTEHQSEKSLFAQIVRVAWTYHPHVFSQTYRAQYVRKIFGFLMQVNQEAQQINIRQLQMRGPLYGADEPEATVPADDDVLEEISSDEEK